MKNVGHLGCVLLLALLTGSCWADSVSNPDVLWVAPQRAEAINCVNSLKLIGLAARLWQDDHGSFPPGFTVLTEELVEPRLLFCPAHYRREPAPTNWNGFAWASIDYEWIAPTNSADETEVFCRCKVHGNLGREDGSADLVPGFAPEWPRIIGSPVSQIASTGSVIEFSFVLTSAVPIRVQWNREDPFWRTNAVFVITNEETSEGIWRTNYIGTNTPIVGATNATFVMTNLLTNHSGYFSVTISNALGAAKSSSARLSVLTNSVFPLTQSLAESLCLNRLKGINLAARMWANDRNDEFPLSFASITNEIGYPLFGSPTLLYCPMDSSRIAPPSWTGVDFSNTSYEMLHTNSSPESYEEPFARCRVHGFVVLGDGSVNLNSSRPVIYGCQTNITALAGQSVSLGVTAGGSSPLWFQWALNQTNLSGATNSILTLAQARKTNEGRYVVTVSNAFGFVTSPEAVLKIVPSMEPPTRTGSSMVFNWADAFVLQTSTNTVQGPYFDVPGAISPYTNSTGRLQQFFRLKN
jgi:hypothetical protein